MPNWTINTLKAKGIGELPTLINPMRISIHICRAAWGIAVSCGCHSARRQSHHSMVQSWSVYASIGESKGERRWKYKPTFKGIHPDTAPPIMEQVCALDTEKRYILGGISMEIMLE